MNEVRLNFQGEHGLRPLAGWSAVKQGERLLTIKKVHPRTAWLFDAGQNTQEISSTSTAAVLTAQVPPSTDGVVSGPLDPSRLSGRARAGARDG